jgi:prepilin-type processing-associated H-X9-DG protein
VSRDFVYLAQWATNINWVGAVAEVNYRLPAAIAADPPPLNSAPWLAAYYARVFAHGSNHPGGSNVAMADGSVRFLADATPVSVLAALSTRAAGEVVDGF